MKVDDGIASLVWEAMHRANVKDMNARYEALRRSGLERLDATNLLDPGKACDRGTSTPGSATSSSASTLKEITI